MTTDKFRDRMDVLAQHVHGVTLAPGFNRRSFPESRTIALMFSATRKGFHMPRQKGRCLLMPQSSMVSLSFLCRKSFYVWSHRKYPLYVKER